MGRSDAGGAWNRYVGDVRSRRGDWDDEWFIGTRFMNVFLLCCYFVLIQVIL